MYKTNYEWLYLLQQASRNLGFPILYGDGSRPSVLQSAGISSPKAVMVMYTGRKRTVEAVQRIRLAFPAVFFNSFSFMHTHRGTHLPSECGEKIYLVLLKKQIKNVWCLWLKTYHLLCYPGCEFLLDKNLLSSPIPCIWLKPFVHAPNAWPLC